ncbi:DUF7411 family protein [Methanothermococcus thermolithotrophicus]|jgi:hypothetical protein|uniref:DUF7411 family protein n=1 Tax=Methanothermococcus thermolithotrophicus TaxID=2186 RepID=UPI00036EFDD8|nr:7-cyano-7-deazaguanine synthase [Methanothermococcus thermolithotrophicus]MDK2987906.1 uncharacterized protein [Methanothermococcus sp.]
MDPRIKEVRLNASMKALDSIYKKDLIPDQVYENLKKLLDLRKPLAFESGRFKENGLDELLNFLSNTDVENDKPKAIVAFSGGVDSTASATISKKIFDVTGVTAFSDYIMVEENKKRVKNTADALKIKHEFVEIDLSEIFEDVIAGKYHPCGRCHSAVERSILEYAANNDIKYIIYGDMLSVGYLSIVAEENGIIRINMPSFLVLTKNESRELLRKSGIEIKQSYGCKLLKKSHNHKQMRKFTIQRILREVRAQVIDKDEGLRNILEVLNL